MQWWIRGMPSTLLLVDQTEALKLPPPPPPLSQGLNGDTSLVTFYYYKIFYVATLSIL